MAAARNNMCQVLIVKSSLTAYGLRIIRDLKDNCVLVNNEDLACVHTKESD